MESFCSEIVEGVFFKIYVGLLNIIIGDFSEFDGKNIVYLRGIDFNYYDYIFILGWFSLEFGLKNYFDVWLIDVFMVIDVFVKEDYFKVGMIVLNRK